MNKNFSIVITATHKNILKNYLTSRMYSAWLGTSHAVGVSPKQAIERLARKAGLQGDCEVQFQDSVPARLHDAVKAIG